MRKADTATRLAITGVGIICSIGRNRSEVWRSIVGSRGGIGKLTKFPGETFPTDVAAEVGDLHGLLPGAKRATKRMSRSDLLAVIAAKEAIEQADDLLRSHHADVAIAGGSDALCRLTYSGFNVLQAVDENPCAPFSEGRKGITLGEGAAYLVIERWDDALARGAAILAELCGYGATCDAYHPTAPHEEGRGAHAAMRGALAETADRQQVDYINAHGTGTLLNDSVETKAILAAVGNAVPVSSSKSYFGHTLGASGGIEAVISV